MSSEEELDYDDDDEEVVQPKRRGKKSKKNKDPNKPKRNMSAYFLYSNANRAQIKADNPEASFGDLAKLISEKFKALSDDERKVWENKAVKDKARYEEEMKHYVSISDDDSDGGGKKKKKVKKDPNAPKRNMSAYFLYSIAMRSTFKEDNPDASFGDLAKMISVAFKGLSEDEKKMWMKKAEEDKERYLQEMEEYQY
mmetsp:Transcript_29053/g.41614  ORF Transcript_29053/g.41614 Transcript_29053/m.41614 type:complete len:197 (+) Transcript_29053:235-825(+)|eukprot:CAMPEP_0172419002 /NCGR_PEP_ID=MMETSP1064-20121228/5439_1 /TAXON_ID=202472 /ORGANISM="Aulacoseira subarctica , Strain CCAP 1002/5" /LENGTH=196 /DNA_ID=CAMNT_0013158219 /DNA_START=155 /DNA_END=745 /DNA_ORIENTATION=+